MWGRLNAGVTVGLLAWGVQACELKKPEIWVLNFGVLSPLQVAAPEAPVINPAAPGRSGTRIEGCRLEPGRQLMISGELRLYQEGGTAALPLAVRWRGMPGAETSPKGGSVLAVEGQIDLSALRDAPPGRYSGRIFLHVTP
jgi:hypothetical protein